MNQENSSQIYAESLSLVPFFEIDRYIVPVSREGVDQFINYLCANASDYDLIVMMGVAEDALKFRIEMLARDVIPEDDQECLTPRTLFSTQSFAHLSWHDYIDNFSFNAGTYYCNYIYYHVLDTIYTQMLSGSDERFLPAVFLHVPPFEAVQLVEGLHWIEDFIGKLMDTQ